MSTKNEKPVVGEIAVINEYGSLHQFYCLTNQLSKNKKVKFISKDDEADNIDWKFSYRGKELILQYNIYNGLCILPSSNRHAAFANELAGSLRTAC
jgi:hypothetical protein